MGEALCSTHQFVLRASLLVGEDDVSAGDLRHLPRHPKRVALVLRGGEGVAKFERETLGRSTCVGTRRPPPAFASPVVLTHLGAGAAVIATH